MNEYEATVTLDDEKRSSYLVVWRTRLPPGQCLRGLRWFLLTRRRQPWGQGNWGRRAYPLPPPWPCIPSQRAKSPLADFHSTRLLQAVPRPTSRTRFRIAAQLILRVPAGLALEATSRIESRLASIVALPVHPQDKARVRSQMLPKAPLLVEPEIPRGLAGNTRLRVPVRTAPGTVPGTVPRATRSASLLAALGH